MSFLYTSQKFNYPFAPKFSSKTLKKRKKRRYFQVDLQLMADSVQWLSQSDYSICISILVEFYLRAAACKYQTSSASSKKSTSILFHQKIPFIKVFSKTELKVFSEFYFSRNRALSDFAQTGLGVTFKIGKFCKCSAASQGKNMKKRKLSLYLVKVYHLTF